MRSVLPSRSGRKVPSGVMIAVRVGVLLLPAGLLLLASLQTKDEPQMLLWLGTACQFLFCFLLVLGQQAWQRPMGPLSVMLYFVALAWMWLIAGSLDAWYAHLTQAVLVVVPLLVFSLQTLTDSGAMAVRHARALAQRLADRKEWPAELAACRTLAEVKALREAIQIDAGPALALLAHSRVEVRVAALASLEFRKSWRPGQAEMVLQVTQRAEEPAVRAAAVAALGNLDDRVLIEALAEFLSDPAGEVRRAAAEALFWDIETRWGWIRYAIRRALADPAFQGDGPLWHNGQLLKPEAIADLTAWAAEKGVLAFRAAQILGVHYRRALNEQPTPALIEAVRSQLANPHAPAVLRMELAQLLKENGAAASLKDRDMLEKLLDSANPAPLRLIAAEALLAGTRHDRAVATLRDIARLANREIALTTADVVQRRLGVDLGLALGQPLPPLHSRLAAEVTRRVMLWAEQTQAGNRLPESGVRNQESAGTSRWLP